MSIGRDALETLLVRARHPLIGATVFGNRCTRLTVPGGRFRITADALLDDPGVPEPE